MKIYRYARYGGWGLLGIAGGLASGSTLQRLAELAGGWVPWSTWMLPISIDVFAVLSILEWKLGPTDRARAHGKWNAWGAIILSGVGNALTHLIVAGVIPVTWLLTALVGSIPAVALGLAVHTAVEPLRPVKVTRRSRFTTPVESTSESLDSAPAIDPPTEPAPELERSLDGSADDASRVELETVIQNIREHRDQHGQPPTRTTYRSQFGKISNERFAVAKKVALNGHSTQH